MKTILLPITFIFLIGFFACKKKEATPEPAASGTTGGTTTGGTPTGLQPSTGQDLCGLQTTYRYNCVGSVVTKDSMVFASFYAAPVTSVAPTYVYAGTVTLNGVNIPYNSSSSYYYITSNPPINIAGPITWSVSGSGTVTAFSQSFTPSYPKYTGGNLLPDTCVKSSGITITISGVTNNQNSVSVYLYSGSASAYKYILGSNGSVTFSSAELASFPASQPITISVDLANVYSATIGGIKRGFTNNLSYIKLAYLKP